MAGINSIFGAVIGDIAGSKYEWHPDKNKKPLDFSGCHITDDTAMTCAVAKGIMDAAGTGDGTMSAGLPADDALRDFFIRAMKAVGRRHADLGYGSRFRAWFLSDSRDPYGSLANGSAMRVSPCGLAARNLPEAEKLAEISAAVTHNHPEGIRGAVAAAGSVFLAKTGHSIPEIREYVKSKGYPMDRTLDRIRPSYRFDVTCAGSVPEALECFLESESYEDTLENAISLGGDSDTQAAIAGAVAWPYYLRRGELDAGYFAGIAGERLDPDLMEIARAFEHFCENR